MFDNHGHMSNVLGFYKKKSDDVLLIRKIYTGWIVITKKNNILILKIS